MHVYKFWGVGSLEWSKQTGLITDLQLCVHSERLPSLSHRRPDTEDDGTWIKSVINLLRLRQSKFAGRRTGLSRWPYF